MKRTITHFVVAMCVASLVRADQTVQSVQQALKDQGFYYGNVTGDKSAETTAAVRRYQIRNGLQVTGEMNPETLWDTTMDPARRTVLKVSIEEAVEADKVFNMLMGDEVAPRKRFIESHAKSANLDV